MDSYSRFDAECKKSLAQAKRLRDNARRREQAKFKKLMATPEWQAEHAQRVIEFQEDCIRQRPGKAREACQRMRNLVRSRIIGVRMWRRRGLQGEGLELVWRDYRRNVADFMEAKREAEALTIRQRQVVVGKGPQQLCHAPRSITPDHDTSTPCCSTTGTATSANPLTSSGATGSTSGTGRSGSK